MPGSQTRLAMMADVAREIGGHSGSISSGTATTAVLSTVLGNLADDALNDDLLVMPDAATAADQERLVTDFVGSSGTATFATRADTTYTSETYFTIPRGTWTLDQIRAAMNFVLGDTKRTYRYVVPTEDAAYQYPLTGLSWLRNAEDVDGVYSRPAPGLLHNFNFAYWQNGTALAPDGFTLAGAAGTVARASTFAQFGPYAVTITRAGTDVTLSQTLPYALARQLIDARATVGIAVPCRATVASRAFGYIFDGTTTTLTSAHTGGSNIETLATSYVLTSAATEVTFGVTVRTGDTSATFAALFAVEGSSVPPDFTNAGERGYLLRPAGDAQLWNIGNGVPMLAMPRLYGRKQQLVVLSRRPYATLSSDAGTTEADSDLIVAGTLCHLAMQYKRGIDAELLDRLRSTFQPVYTNIASGLIDKPPQTAQAGGVLVRGA